MKKVFSISYYVLFGMSALLPAGKLICNYIGYTFRLSNACFFAILISFLSVCTMVLSIISGKTSSTIIRILLGCSVPLSLINILLYVYEGRNTFVYVCTVITAAFALFLLVWHGRFSAWKIVVFLLTTILSLYIYSLGFMSLLFVNIGQTTVTRTIESPDAAYRAEVLDIDQGALGGDTVVDVYENSKRYNFCFFTVSKKPQRVYFGNWGEFQTMNIYWKNPRCLVINSDEYNIE